MIHWFLKIIGGFLTVMELVQFFRLSGWLGELNDYGKGYLAGSIMLAIVGVILIILGFKLKKK